MAYRVVFANSPLVYHPSGLKLKRNECPCPKQLIEELLKDVLLSYNPPELHRCSSLCRQSSQILIGYPYTEDVRTAVSDEFEEKLQIFEDAVTFHTDDEEYWYKEKMEVHSIVLRFLPCVKYLEVINAAIYLY